MHTTIVYMLKNSRGDLVPSTIESSPEECEAFCQKNVPDYERQKEAGSKIVPVTLTELSSDEVKNAATQAPTSAADRVDAFLKQRASARGMHPDEIAMMNAGSEREASLLTADLQALVDFAGVGR